MSKIEKKELELLLSIIPNHPLTQLFHINDYNISLSNDLNDFVKKNEFEYDITTTNEDFLEELNNKIENISNKTTIHKLDLKQHRYNRHSKIYDFVFVTMDIDKIEDLGLFFKKLHSIIKNSGYLLLFIEKNQNNLPKILQLLEDKLYVAINTIDISTKYEVISAKKMHGWGN